MTSGQIALRFMMLQMICKSCNVSLQKCHCFDLYLSYLRFVLALLALFLFVTDDP